MSKGESRNQSYVFDLHFINLLIHYTQYIEANIELTLTRSFNSVSLRDAFLCLRDKSIPDESTTQKQIMTTTNVTMLNKTTRDLYN